MSDKIKNHPAVMWTLCVLITGLDIIAVALSFILGYSIFISLLEDFSLLTLAFLIVPIVCIIGAILIQGKFYSTFIED